MSMSVVDEKISFMVVVVVVVLTLRVNPNTCWYILAVRVL